MYINASVYEDLYLRGQGIEAVEREVLKMRSELRRLKYNLETPANRGTDYLKYPSELESINATREYLNRALLYFAELKGDNSVLTEEERDIALVRSMRMHVARISLSLGEYTYVIDVLNEKIVTECNGDVVSEHRYERSLLLSAIADIRIEEWREEYSAQDYGCTLISPEPWSLEVDYGEAMAPRRHHGDGVYPYNFGALRRLLRIN
jgi:hypothetical protein